MNFRDIKKKLKLWMKEYMGELSEKLKNGKLSSKSLGIIIRTFHMSAPPLFIYNLLIAPYFICNITIAFLFIVGILFYTFDCCFLSILEQKLCEDEFIIMDPMLELCDLEINTKNRYFISNIVGIPYLIIACIIYYIRFYR